MAGQAASGAAAGAEARLGSRDSSGAPEFTQLPQSLTRRRDPTQVHHPLPPSLHRRRDPASYRQASPSPEPIHEEEQAGPREAVERTYDRPTEDWIAAVLEAHNSRRSAHYTPPLIWSDECYYCAARQADACADADELHRGNDSFMSGKHGQCLQGPLKFPLSMKARSAEKAVEKWYQESKLYNFAKAKPNRKAENFTQMMWVGSTSVGMAVSHDGKYVVANYFPAGNTAGVHYAKNVLPPAIGEAPWMPAEPDPLDPDMPACCAENWRRHDEVSRLLAEAGAERKSQAEDEGSRWG